jgi:putative glutamine amidotransferase
MKKIGLTQQVEYLPDRDERRDCLDQKWTEILLGLNLMPVPIPNRIIDIESFIDRLRIEGIVLTGGNDLSHLPEAKNTAPERDGLEHKLLNLCAAKDIPLFGVCRGMQIMVVHYGGTTLPVAGHVATYHRLRVVKVGVMPLTDREEINSFHDYGIPDSGLGNHLQPIAVSDDGTVEAVAHTKFRQWAIMWHPERDPFDSRDRTIMKRLFCDN